MLDINPQGKKLMLSIDGGGTRGILVATMLAELEQMTGKTCPEMFDMVAGTSTGAIIAAGIGLGMSAAELLRDVYRTRLPEAFRAQPRGIPLYLRYLLGGLRNLYRLEPFTERLMSFAGGKRIRDFDKPIVLLTTRDVRTANVYFIVSKGPGAARFADWPVSGAVFASGAAPVIFPPTLGNLIDGGVGTHGNPCLAATIEAMEYIGPAEGFTNGNVIHYSIGTGYRPSTRSEGAAGRFWLKDWLLYLIGESLNDTSLNQVFTTRAIYRGRVDYRRFNPYLERTSVEETLGIAMQGRPDPAVSGLGPESATPEVLDLLEEIGRAYARKVSWTESDYTPWVKSGSYAGTGRDGGHPLPGIEPVEWDDSAFH